MLSQMSIGQLQKWAAYYAIEPFGERRADLRAASVVASVYNVNRDTKKRRKPWPISDFVLRFDEEERRQADKPKDWKYLKMMGAAIAAPHKRKPMPGEA